ncbi:histidine phosphatase family protein [Isoptericola croceus]|uniref:histidine phosphatase family protein n=1 Tax=Isoptericola croceus TaxID=3031406 RepID=UPI0023F7D68C|nr:histidine phosphatase family protein [Isoptericola croceus]
MALYLVRHGRPSIVPGTPAPAWQLDPKHEDAVAELASRAPWSDDAVWFTSPEPKAARTAYLLAGREVDVVDDLREHDRGVGAWVDDFQNAMAEAFARPDSAVRDGWEALEETRRRVVKAARELLVASPGKDVVLVGHGTAWTLLAAELTGTEPDLERWRTLAMPDVITVHAQGLPRAADHPTL